MNKLLICTHYGFGDYVICYGLIKELSKMNDIVLFAMSHRSKLHIENIKRLYSSIKNLEISTDNPRSYKNVLYIGWDKFTNAIKIDPSIPFPRFFYDQVNIPLEKMWDNFYFERDIKREHEIYYDVLGLKDGEEYIFTHDDPARNFVIDKKYINSDLRIIHFVELEDISILDSLYLVEKSKEVHITTTGLVAFIDLMNIQHGNLNLHRYVRSSPFEQMILRLKWNVID